MHIFLGTVAILIAVISYSLYFRDVLAGKTKPHAFTWLIWSSLNMFIFYAQIMNNGGPGAWVTGAAAIANGLIFLLALRYGEKNIALLDWLCLLIALTSLGIWLVYPDGELSILLACALFVIGFIPTLRKSFRKAHEETAITFGLNSIKFFIALFALSSVTITTALFPFLLFIINGFFACFLFVRQQSSAKRNKVRKRPRKVTA